MQFVFRFFLSLAVSGSWKFTNDLRLVLQDAGCVSDCIFRLDGAVGFLDDPSTSLVVVSVIWLTRVSSTL